MNLLRYLHEQSWKLLWLSTACALVSGLAGASLVALISKGIGNNVGLDTLAWLFFGNCLVYMLAKTASELSLLHLTQRAILQLRINLSNKVLATPARRLQELAVGMLGALSAGEVYPMLKSAMRVRGLDVGQSRFPMAQHGDADDQRVAAALARVDGLEEYLIG